MSPSALADQSYAPIPSRAALGGPLARRRQRHRQQQPPRQLWNGQRDNQSQSDRKTLGAKPAPQARSERHHLSVGKVLSIGIGHHRVRAPDNTSIDPRHHKGRSPNLGCSVPCHHTLITTIRPSHTVARIQAVGISEDATNVRISRSVDDLHHARLFHHLQRLLISQDRR